VLTGVFCRGDQCRNWTSGAEFVNLFCFCCKNIKLYNRLQLVLIERPLHSSEFKIPEAIRAMHTPEQANLASPRAPVPSFAGTSIT